MATPLKERPEGWDWKLIRSSVDTRVAYAIWYDHLPEMKWKQTVQSIIDMLPLMITFGAISFIYRAYREVED